MRSTNTWNPQTSYWYWRCGISGKPVIRGTRITVSDILEYLAGGMSEAEILEDFPDLEAEDISAALTFAAERERRLFSAL